MNPRGPSSLRPQRIVIGANAHAELAPALRAALPAAEVRGNKYDALTADDLSWGDTYVGFKRPLLATMGNIRWVHCTGAGVDAWLYPDELPREILLTRTAESFGPMIAEWTLARMLGFTQHLLAFAESQRRREWQPRPISFVRGTHAVIVGTGDVGAHIGRLLAALGCRVTGISRSGRGDPAIFASVHPVSSLEIEAATADWLILALPLTAATRGLVNRTVLASCRGAVLINAGRGAVVEEAAITEALDAGWLSGAALDVFDVEPLPVASPLWDDARVMISPHISGPTTIDGAVAGFLECVHELDRGVWPTRTVDRERQY